MTNMAVVNKYVGSQLGFRVALNKFPGFLDLIGAFLMDVGLLVSKEIFTILRIGWNEIYQVERINSVVEDILSLICGEFGCKLQAFRG